MNPALRHLVGLLATVALAACSETLDKVELPHPQLDGIFNFVAASPEDVWWFHQPSFPEHPLHHFDGSSWADVFPEAARNRQFAWFAPMSGGRLAVFDQDGGFLVNRDSSVTELGIPVPLQDGEKATFQIAAFRNRLFVATDVQVRGEPPRNHFHIYESGAWKELAAPAHPISTLKAAAADEVWALMTPWGSNQTTVLVRFDGTSWTQLPSPPAIHTPFTVAGKDRAWQILSAPVGEGSLYYSEWNGTEWVQKEAVLRKPDDNADRFAPFAPLPYDGGVAFVGLRQYLPGNAADQETRISYSVPDGDGVLATLSKPENLATIQDTCEPFCSGIALSFYGLFTPEVILVADPRAMWVGKLPD